jgi:hypothetical protein
MMPGAKLRVGTRVDRWMGRSSGIHVVATYSGTTGPDVTTITASPTAVKAGDVLVVSAMWESTIARTYAVTVNNSETFTELHNFGSVALGQVLGYCVVDTDNDYVVTGTINTAGSTSSHSLVVLHLRGVDSSSPVDVAQAYGTLTASTSQTVPGVTVNSAGALVVAALAIPLDVSITPDWVEFSTAQVSGQSVQALSRRVVPTDATSSGVCVVTLGSSINASYITAAFRAAGI